MSDAPGPDRVARRAASRRRRWYVIGAVVAVVAVVVVAVVLLAGGDDDDGSDRASGSDSPTTTVAAAPGAPPPTNDAEPLETGVCSSDQLVAERPSIGLAAQTSVAVFAVTNRSETPCTLNGIPALAIVAADGDQPTVVTEGGGAIPPELVAQEVTLEPGGQASFQASWVSVPGPGSGDATCSKGDALRVAPPDSDGGVRVEGRITACFGGSINVSPFQPGVLTF